jgi:hypothetical protein
MIFSLHFSYGNI